MTNRFLRTVAAVTLLASSVAAETLAGRVVDDHTGAPLPSANVRVSKAGVRGLVADLETDREGRFEAASLPAGTYRLDVSKPNFVSLGLEATAGTAAVARLIRRGVISGRVTNQQSQPVIGVIVSALLKPAGGGPWRALTPDADRASAITTADGTYRIFNLPPGEYAVVIAFGASTRAVGSSGRASTAPNLGSGFLFYPSNARPTLLAVTGAEDHRNIDFTLFIPPLFSVSGKVETAEPTASYWVALILPEQPGLAVAVAPGQNGGAFRFEGVPTGSYRIVAAKFSGARGPFGGLLAKSPDFAQSTVAVGGQNVEGLVLRPERGVAVRVALRAAPGCPASAQLTMTSVEDWGSDLTRRTTLTAAEPVDLADLAPARYILAATSEGNACYLESAMSLDLSRSLPGDPIEIKMAPAGSLRGRVDTGGRPPSGFAVALIPAEDAASVQLAAPDAQARFTFGSLRPGRYRIAAYPLSQRIPPMTSMFEFEVRGGSNAEIDLAVPQEESR